MTATLQEERAAAAGRRQAAKDQADADALVARARRLLNRNGWKASREVLIESALEMWAPWPEEARTAVVEKALELAGSERTDQRRIDPQEDDVQSPAEKQKMLDALRALLTERPAMKAADAYELLQGRGVGLCKYSSFQGHHMVAIRKELGIDARGLKGKSVARTAAAPAATKPARVAEQQKPAPLPKAAPPKPAPAAARAAAPTPAAPRPKAIPSADLVEELSPYFAFVVRTIAAVRGCPERDVLEQIMFSWISDHVPYVSDAGAGIDAFRNSGRKAKVA